MNPSRIALAVLCLLAASAARADTVKDREGAVRDDKAKMERDGRWLYNDVEAGFAEAKKTEKPLLVVLRCVPCLSCMGLDAGILEDASLAPLLDRFVCLRVINANAIDLERFQFDYDLSMTTLMFNGDGTVYGRFGSWTHQKNARETATAGFRAALSAVLAIHETYPGNRAALLGKQGGPVPFRTPLEIPGLAGKYTKDLDWQGQVVRSCVHCHMIGDALRTTLRERREPIPDELIYPQPAPETIGLTLDDGAAARVVSVAADSPAARAGIAAGDDLVTLAGQPLVSIADVSWALHRAPAAGTIGAVVSRGGAARPVEIPIAEGWRRKADISRRVGTWAMRGMATGGLVFEDVPDAERAALPDLAAGKLALRVKHVGQYGQHAAAKNAGWQEGDVLVELDGGSDRLTESELLGRLLEEYRPGDSPKAVVLRGGRRTPLSLPMQ